MRKTKWWKRKHARELIWKIGITTVVASGLIIVFIPIVWMVFTSLSSPSDVVAGRWLPTKFVWKNYLETVTVAIPYFLYFKNTLIITLLTLIGVVLSSSLVAYGFSRLRAPGRDALFLILLSSLMLPPQVTMVPLFLLFNRFGWLDTYAPLIVPFWFGGTPFYVFLLRQFYRTLPMELDEAAKIDGCNVFGIYWKIILPLSKPVLAAVAIFTFMWKWNDFMPPLIYLNTMEKYPLSLGLTFLKSGHGIVQWNFLMAASVLTMLPCIVIFFFAQKYFIQGIVVTGIKG